MTNQLMHAGMFDTADLFVKKTSLVFLKFRKLVI